MLDTVEGLSARLIFSIESDREVTRNKELITLVYTFTESTSRYFDD